jgi:hypothetical protein
VAIAFVTSSFFSVSSAGEVASDSVTLPAGIVAGDTIVFELVIANSQATGTYGTLGVTSTGTTPVQVGTTYQVDSIGINLQSAVYAYTATSADAGATLKSTPQFVSFVSIAGAVYSGCSGTQPDVISQPLSSIPGGNFNAPPAVTLTAGDWAVYPALAQHAFTSNPGTSRGSNSTGLTVAYADSGGSAGAAGTTIGGAGNTWDNSSSWQNGWTIGLKPAGSTPPPALYPLPGPARARLPFPARTGRTAASAGAYSGTGPPVTPLARPVRAALPPSRQRDQIPARPQAPPAPGAPAAPLRGPVRAQPQFPVRHGRATSRARPLSGPGPVYPLLQPVRARLVPAQRRGHAYSGPGAYSGTGPALRPLTGPVRGQPQAPVLHGRSRNLSPPPPVVPPAAGPQLYPLHGPAAARPAFPFLHGRPQGHQGAYSGTGPAIPPRATPVTARQPLPPRGRVIRQAGAYSGTGPALTPLRQPVTPARRPPTRAGRSGGSPGVFSGTGPALRPPSGPVALRRPRPGRPPQASGLPGAPFIPTAGPQVYPLHGPVGLAPRLARRPGRALRSLVTPSSFVPFRYVTWQFGAPLTSWEPGVPRSAWEPGVPRTSWEAAVAGITISSLSTVNVQVPVLATIGGVLYNPTADEVQMAFTQNGNPVTWNAASWTSGPGTGSYLAECLVGPSGTVDLATGTWSVWVKITDNPEIPVINAGLLVIV